MGQCQSSVSPALAYKVDAAGDLDLPVFVLSNSTAYNRGLTGSGTQTLKGVKGATTPQDFLPSLKKKRRASKDDTAARLSTFTLVAKGSPRGATAKLLLTTKAPRLKNVGPPTLDIIFQDQTKVRIGYQHFPQQGDAKPQDENSWMATSIHFDDFPRPRFRLQMTRKNFPFLIQIFDGKKNITCASILTYGAFKNQPRKMHAYHGNIDTAEKAKDRFYSEMFSVLDEEDGTLAFQHALTTDVEKATFCVMFLLRTRLLTFNGEW